MNKREIAVILAISLSLLLVIGATLYKPSIHNAVYYDLIQVDEVGDIRATAILNYLKINPDAKLEHLTLIDGIGEKILSNLKRRFR